MKNKITIIQKLGWFYAGLFFFVVLLGYIPGFTRDGQLFGLFSIDPIDDLLHLGSAIWAGFAAWHSLKYSIFYFKAFGFLYCLDGIIGLIFGNGYLDLAIFFHGTYTADLFTKLALNIPHILIGGLAIYFGFILSKKYK